MDDWAKILATAVVSSTATAVVAEPLKSFVNERVRRHTLRVQIYLELTRNFLSLSRMAHDGGQLERDDLVLCFGTNFKASAFELAEADRLSFLRKPDAEEITFAYNSMKHLARDLGSDGSDAVLDKDEWLGHASLVPCRILLDLANGRLDKRLFKKGIRHKRLRRVIGKINPSNVSKFQQKLAPYESEKE
jgi:hypothetical protein